VRGLNLGIDFSGGILIELQFDRLIPLNELRAALAGSKLGPYELQSFPQKNLALIKVKGSMEQSDIATAVIKESLDKVTTGYSVVRTEFVGPRVGKHLLRMAYLAILFSFLGIIIYVAIRFKSGIWGVAGVVALIHDVFITLSVFSILGLEVDLTVVAALLSLAGYSINDTIVVFDRIRENLVMMRKEPLANIISGSINQTLSRTIITSLCTELVVLALFFFGGDVLHNFSFALLFGIFIGTYSSIFIASPIVYEWNKKK
jgi:preprotein translocase subunit SecF